MNEKFIRERISALRTRKGVSEYKMSLDLGHSKTYIQSISSGRSLPSMTEFLYICDYFGVTPAEFFDAELPDAALTHELCELIKRMSPREREALLELARCLAKK